MSARSASPHGKQASAAEIADRLFAEQKDPEEGFSREQFRRAVGKFLEICPTAEIDRLSHCGDATVLGFECSLEEAIELVGREFLPLPPHRVRYDTPSWISRVRRTRNLRMQIYADLGDEDGAGALTAFTPTEIRKLAPDEPQSAREWKEHLRGQLERRLNFVGSSFIEDAIRQPVNPRGASSKDLAKYRDAMAAANARFRLRESDLHHLLGLFTKLQREALQAMMTALDAARVESAQGSPLRLVVDNSVRP